MKKPQKIDGFSWRDVMHFTSIAKLELLGLMQMDLVNI